MADCFEVLCGLTAILLVLYYYLTSNFDFWETRGVPGPQPIPVFGNYKDVILGKTWFADYFKQVYADYKNEPMFGIFTRKTPVLVLNDPNLIKDVLIKDFSVFADRGFTVPYKAEPLTQSILNFEPARWRPLRARLSPVFSTNKLKDMFYLMLECSEQLEKRLEQLVAKGEPVECRELAAKYTTDVIGSCAFGIEMNALSDENSEFRRMGRKIFTFDFERVLRIRMREYMPRFYNFLGYVLPQTEITKFFTKIIAETMEYRKQNVVRHDFIDTLLDLQRNPDKLRDLKLTDTLFAAQAFIFFAAGFEPSSTTMCNVLYELALNPEVQKKLREEIKQEYVKNNGDLRFDNLKKMTYLDGVVRETLRKYPPGPIIKRKSTSSYTFESTRVTIPKDTSVWMPAYAFSYDPSIYPSPEVFDPERFNEDSVATRHPMYFLPFGDGPRNCIGARFAVYQIKVGLVKIVHNYRVDVCEKTQIPYINDPSAVTLTPKGGVYLKISKAES